ncbi:MAG: zf-HC2 domain-containing protein [Acidobacteria bacterium]|nr:zf-HC2 domain-containing protein [Acidobacteriota bacterium]
MRARGSDSGENRAESRHEEFLELCALSLASSLDEAERMKLNEHLATCPDCRRAVEDYRLLIRSRLPALAPSFLPDSPPVAVSWSQESAKRELFQSLASEGASSGPSVGCRRREIILDLRHAIGRLWPSVYNQLVRGELYLRYAAIVIVAVGLGFAGYRIGVKQGMVLPRASDGRINDQLSSLQVELDTLMKERAARDLQIVDRDNALRDLTNQIARQQVELSNLREAEKNLNDQASTAQAENAHIASERDRIATKLSLAEASAAANDRELETLRQQRKDELLRSASLEVRIRQLADLLRQRDELLARQEKTVEQQQQLLAADRDIRELMGARQLYIAEVYDVAGDGQTEKPFGRIFFTKGKSLIFYAYDLDQQAGVRKASAFQAWGRRSRDRSQALNLGIMYIDTAGNKRWVLQFNDPETLAQIDAVFVTVEPNGGSRQPTGKRLLYAYLGVPPNHP